MTIGSTSSDFGTNCGLMVVFYEICQRVVLRDAMEEDLRLSGTVNKWEGMVDRRMKCSNKRSNKGDELCASYHSNVRRKPHKYI